MARIELVELHDYASGDKCRMLIVEVLLRKYGTENQNKNLSSY